MADFDFDNLTPEWYEKENRRLKALFEYNISFLTPEEELDAITKLLSIICKTPISLVTLLDESKVWFKSNVGIEGVTFSERKLSFCKYVIEQSDIWEISNTHEDLRFVNHPFVIGKSGIRFYAGIPLVTPSGYNIGVLCVIDHVPRKLNLDQRIAMITLARHIIMHFELTKSNLNLKFANEKANKLAKAKDDFLSNMSHEIRTPLNAIYGFTELLNKTSLDKNQEEMLDIIRSSVEILMAIINDILDFSKIESGKLSIENHPFNFEDAIRTIKDLFSQKAIEKKLNLNFNIDRNIPRAINGDKIRVNQILINLIANAIKFTNKGFVELTIKLIEDTENKVGIHFSVRDSGIGIPEDRKIAIFERFEQASSDINRKFGGTGLGLSISKSLVELQGGKLAFNSQLNVGSNFYFTLYFNKVHDEAVEKILRKEKKNCINKQMNNDNQKKRFDHKLKKLVGKTPVKILVLEDTYFNYKLVENIFEDTIIQLDLAENGIIGLEKMKKIQYDMILLDLQMPEMDGFEVANYLRKVKKSDILIIAMTANNSEKEKIRCLELGMNHYFTKPFKQNDLLNAIIKVFYEKYQNQGKINNDLKVMFNHSLNNTFSNDAEKCIHNRSAPNAFMINKNTTQRNTKGNSKNAFNLVTFFEDEKDCNDSNLEENHKVNNNKLNINYRDKSKIIKNKSKSFFCSDVETNRKISTQHQEEKLLKKFTEGNVLNLCQAENIYYSDADMLKNLLKKRKIKNVLFDFLILEDINCLDFHNKTSNLEMKYERKMKKNFIYNSDNMHQDEILMNNSHFFEGNEDINFFTNFIHMDDHPIVYKKYKENLKFQKPLSLSVDMGNERYNKENIPLSYIFKKNSGKQNTLNKTWTTSKYNLEGNFKNNIFKKIKSKFTQHKIENSNKKIKEKKETNSLTSVFNGQIEDEKENHIYLDNQDLVIKNRNEELENSEVFIKSIVNNKSEDSIWNTDNSNINLSFCLENEEEDKSSNIQISREKEEKPFIFEEENFKINYEYLNEISAGDFDCEKELVDVFLKEFPIKIDQLEISLNQNDYNQIHILSHSIKTTLTMLGLDVLKNVFFELEQKSQGVLNRNNSINFHDIENSYMDISKFIKKLKNVKILFKEIEKSLELKYK